MSLNQEKMTSIEKRVALSLSAIFASRMLGLFMVLPVFALYAEELEGFTPTLAGLAIGIYGLTQAIFQIPLGMLSDHIGRKRVIIGGLVIFALGSVVAALADSITGVIVGRALQGAGAIASAVMALAADLTREEHRIKVMASIGMSIGLSFALALIIGPMLHGWFGVEGIFWLTALLALGGIMVAKFLVPSPILSRFHRDAEVEIGWFRQALSDPQLLRLDAGIFILHFILVSQFVVMPGILRDELGFALELHWHLYLPVLFFAVLTMIPFIILAEKKRKIKQV
ncbi:MAG: MFS transporter, partial [Gammaproteobacteria bacterium]|nr:MFS transporter [Gammaproteobacteria bacterium]